MHFSQLMTAKLSDTVKLVGSTVSCEGAVNTTVEGELPNPHVQSFAVATDQTGAPRLPCCDEHVA